MLRRPDSYVTFINGCLIQARIPMPLMCISAYAFYAEDMDIACKSWRL
jgi:hypothetical protein